MKKLLLTGFAALFLATGTAHAGCHEYFFRCDNKLVSVQGCTKLNFMEVISRTITSSFRAVTFEYSTATPRTAPTIG